MADTYENTTAWPPHPMTCGCAGGHPAGACPYPIPATGDLRHKIGFILAGKFKNAKEHEAILMAIMKAIEGDKNNG
jgi:hypothetical protein